MPHLEDDQLLAESVFAEKKLILVLSLSLMVVQTQLLHEKVLKSKRL